MAKSVAPYIWYIKTAPIKCKTPKIRSALKYLSAISPIIKGAIIAPQDWVEKAIADSAPVAFKFLAKKVPRVTNHPPQIKNSRNIMVESCNLIVVFICVYLVAIYAK